MPISPQDFFEYCLIVPDMEEAIRQLHDALGYTFSPILEGVIPTRDAEGGDLLPVYRMAVSIESPEIELIETLPGTPFVPPAGTGLHHVGYYVDDLASESERMTSLGLPFVRGGFHEDTFPHMWAYHRMPDGTLLELVDRATRPMRENLKAGRIPDPEMGYRLVPVPESAGGQPRS